MSRPVLHGLVQVLQQRHRLQVGDVAVFVGDPLAVLLSKVAVDPPWKKRGMIFAMYKIAMYKIASFHCQGICEYIVL